MSATKRSSARLAVLLLLVVSATGCSSSSGPTGGGQSDDLSTPGTVYLNCHDVNGQGPANWDALIEFAGDDQQQVAASERMRDAGYQVKWEVRMQDVGQTQGITSFVPASSPQGGPKLMLDGTVAP